MLKLPNNYVLDGDCMDLLFTHVKDYIIYAYKDNKLHDFGIDIYLYDMFLKIKYHNHYYWVAIVKVNNVFHYYLRPYKKEHFVIHITSPSIFDEVINAIKEHDKLKYKTKES